MAVTTDDLAYFNRGEVFPTLFGKASTFGLDIFNRGEIAPELVKVSLIATSVSFSNTVGVTNTLAFHTANTQLAFTDTVGTSSTVTTQQTSSLAFSNAVGITETAVGPTNKPRSLANTVAITETIAQNLGFGDIVQHPTRTVSSVNVTTFASPAYTNTPLVGNTDFLFAVSSATISTPAGYSRDIFDTNNAGIYIFRRVVVAGDTNAAVTLTVGNRPCAIARLELTGAHALEASSARFYNSSATTARSGTSVSTSNRDTFLLFASDEQTANQTWSGLSNPLIVQDSMVPSGGTVPRNGVVAWAQHVASGTVTLSATSTTNTAQYQLLTAAYKPRTEATANLADTVGVTNTLTVVLVLRDTLADTVGITDSVSPRSALALSFADATGITDVLTRQMVEQRSFANTVGVSDVLAKQLALRDALADPIGVTDQVTIVAVLARTCANTVGVTDALSGHSVQSRSFGETVGITDAMSASHGIQHITVAVADTVGITDVVSGHAAAVIVAVDTVGISATVARMGTRSRTFTDAVEITETARAITAKSAQLTGTVGITDVLLSGSHFRPSFSDAVGVSGVQSKHSVLHVQLAGTVGIIGSMHAHAIRKRPFVKSPTTCTVVNSLNLVAVRSGGNSTTIRGATNHVVLRNGTLIP